MKKILDFGTFIFIPTQEYIHPEQMIWNSCILLQSSTPLIETRIYEFANLFIESPMR